jgi:hypothetical protein
MNPDPRWLEILKALGPKTFALTAAFSTTLGGVLLLLSVSAQAQAAELSVPKYRFDNEPIMGPKIVVVAEVKNSDSQRLEGWACLRLYDKDGFEIKSALSPEVNVGAGAADSVTITSYIRDGLIQQVKTSKLYIARYGCAEAPSAAVSNVRVAHFVSR